MRFISNYPMSYVGLFALLLSTLSACSFGPSPKAGQSFADLEMLVGDAEVKEQKMGELNVELPWHLTNPCKLPIMVEKAEWKLLIEGEGEATGVATINKTIAPGETFDGLLPAKLSLPVDSAAFERHKASPTQRFEATATFTVKSKNQEELFAADWAGEVLSAQGLSVVVTLAASRIGDTIETNFTLSVKNNNPFAVHLQGLDYVMTVAGEEIGKGSAAAEQKGGAGAEMLFEITKFIGREGFEELAHKLRGQNEIPYTVTTLLKFEGQEKSQTHDGMITFSR